MLPNNIEHKESTTAAIEKPLPRSDTKPLRPDARALQGELLELTGRDILARILNHEKPQEFVQHLPPEDFYWVIKKVGEEDCVPLLQLATNEQWQYVLDLEIWERDRLDLEITAQWMKRLQETDCKRLVKWLVNEGEYLAFFHFHKIFDVTILGDKDDIYDLPDGYITHDGVLYIKIRDPEYRESVESILTTLASTDPERYRALILGLSGVVPAETEEEMYRQRNVRLAEHGFLPYEEAIFLYSPLEPEDLRCEPPPSTEGLVLDEEIQDLVPVSSFQLAGGRNMLVAATSGTQDPVFIDRLRLEFAGLCNQIISADSLLVRDLDILIKAARKAAGYVNLGLERICGKDLARAQEILKNHSLVSLFRVGFGLALKLKWEAERWMKNSWFQSKGLGTEFWGQYWGGILDGLLSKRPRYYAAPQEDETHRGFEWLSELTECLTALRHMMVLDGLLDQLSQGVPLSENVSEFPGLTFRTLLFTPWSRLQLGLSLSFEGITLKQIRDFFLQLRGKGVTPPYPMPGGKEAFVKDLMTYASNADLETAAILKQTLQQIWEEFREEYESVSLKDLDDRYLRYFSIHPEELGQKD